MSTIFQRDAILKNNISWLPGVVLIVMLSIPLVFFLLQNIYIFGVGEESIGYRYFYSLRIVYENIPSPTLPQGHLLTDVHCLIQYLLTFFGYPINNLNERMYMFSYMACAFSLITIFISFIWALKPINNYLVKLILTLLLVCNAYHLRNGAGYHLILPDYTILSLTVALLFLGFAVREIQDPKYILNWILFALYSAMCFTLKINYLLLPIMLFMIQLQSLNIRKILELSLKVSVAFILLSSVVFLVYYKGNISSTIKHFLLSTYTSYSAKGNVTFWSWSLDTIFSHGFDGTTLIVLTPYILLLGLFIKDKRKYTFPLLIGAWINYIISFQRPYPPTFAEASNFSIIICTVWICALMHNKVILAQIKAKSTVVKIGVVAVLLCLAINEIADFFNIFIPAYKDSKVATEQLNSYLDSIQGNTLYIIPSNNHRPATIDSTIYKGGLNLENARWPQSKLVASFNTGKHYLVASKDDTINLELYEKIIYVASKGGEFQQRIQIYEQFGINLDDYSCNFVVSQGIGGMNWFLPYLYANISNNSLFYPMDAYVPRMIIGCRKKNYGSVT